MKKRILVIGLFISIIFLGLILLSVYKIPKNFCSLVPAEEFDMIQSCCDEWALQNEIGHIKCVGNWMIKEGECSWSCDLLQEPNPLHWCIYPAAKTNKTPEELVQDCCNEWAIEKQVGHIKCVGEWTYEGGHECKWNCFEY